MRGQTGKMPGAVTGHNKGLLGVREGFQEAFYFANHFG